MNGSGKQQKASPERRIQIPSGNTPHQHTQSAMAYSLSALVSPNLESDVDESVDENAEAFCRREYPEMVAEFEEIQREMFQMFCKKQRNYGPGNISVGTQLKTPDEIKLSLTGLWFRLNDKIQRLKQLVVLGHPDEVGEAATDTYQDLSIYGIIAQIVLRDKWAK